MKFHLLAAATVSGLAAGLLTAPTIVANHGLWAIYMPLLLGLGGYDALYESGEGDQQVWFFFGEGGGCKALGSIETGFSGLCVEVGGTGHYHEVQADCGWPDPPVDDHLVDINGLPGRVLVFC